MTSFVEHIHVTPIEMPFKQEPQPVKSRDPIQERMFLAVGLAAFMGLLLAVFQPRVAADDRPAGELVTTNSAAQAGVPAVGAGQPNAGTLSPIFRPEVLYWTPQILSWAAQFQLDPNLVATIMQVESCGDPRAVSSAGAQGLFQVMPFHFQADEQMLDPDTNARRGLAYFVDRLEQTGNRLGLAFAGYNGGQAAAASGWDDWSAETRRYYLWTTGILEDIRVGSNPSPTLQRWLEAGGASLCRQAATRLQLDQ